jgi:predicted nucleotidyltransferase
MTKRDRLALKEFAARVKARYLEARIWAFGSRVRGDARQDSDLDICVVVPELDRTAWEEISDIAWEVGFENDLLITTVKFDRDAFEHGVPSESPLVQAILREGVAA